MSGSEADAASPTVGVAISTPVNTTPPATQRRGSVRTQRSPGQTSPTYQLHRPVFTHAPSNDAYEPPMPPPRNPNRLSRPVSLIVSSPPLERRKKNHTRAPSTPAPALLPAPLITPRLRSASSAGSPIGRSKSKLTHIMDEILETEQTYARDLSLVRTVYMASAPVAARGIFGNLPELETFAWQLVALFQSGDHGHMGRIFQSAVEEQLQPLYSVYCSRHAHSMALLTSIAQEPDVIRWLSDCRKITSTQTNAWDLPSLLIKPVQRVLKYPMLLRAAMDATPVEDPRKESLRGAVEALERVAERINEVNRRKDAVEKVFLAANPKRMPRSRSSSVSLNNVSGVSSNNLSVSPSSPKLGMTRSDSQTSPMATSSGLRFLRVGGKKKGESINSFTLPLTLQEEESLHKLEQKLMSHEATVKDFITNISTWDRKTASSITSQVHLLGQWTMVINLYGTEVLEDLRMDAWVKTLRTIFDVVWKDMHLDIKDNVLPLLTKTLIMIESPKMIRSARDLKAGDYARAQSTGAFSTQTSSTGQGTGKLSKSSSFSNLDKKTREGTDEYLCLHAQLLLELPAFLKLCGKLFNIALRRLIKIQSNYFKSVNLLISQFMADWSGDDNMKVLDGNEIIHLYHRGMREPIAAIEKMSILELGSSPLIPDLKTLGFTSPSEFSGIDETLPPSRPLSHISTYSAKRSTAYSTTSSANATPNLATSFSAYPNFPLPNNVTSSSFRENVRSPSALSTRLPASAPSLAPMPVANEFARQGATLRANSPQRNPHEQGRRHSALPSPSAYMPPPLYRSRSGSLTAATIGENNTQRASDLTSASIYSRPASSTSSSRPITPGSRKSGISPTKSSIPTLPDDIHSMPTLYLCEAAYSHTAQLGLLEKIPYLSFAQGDVFQILLEVPLHNAANHSGKTEGLLLARGSRFEIGWLSSFSMRPIE